MTGFQKDASLNDSRHSLDCNEKESISNNSPRAFSSISNDNMQVSLDKSLNALANDLNLSKDLDKVPQRQITSKNIKVGSSFSGSTVQHGYVSLCSKSNILATFNDTKQRLKILDKKIGFVSVPIARVLNWEQGTIITAPSMLQWTIKTHKLVSRSKVENYKNARIIVPSDLKINNCKTLMKNHPDNVLVQYLEYGFPLGIDKAKFCL